MKLYLFSRKPIPNPAVQGIRKTLDLVARSTDTGDLVVALYLLPGIHAARGTAYTGTWLTPRQFLTGRGRWAFTKSFDLPLDLPNRFKLIRIRMDWNPSLFPRVEIDRYGWEFTYNTFHDHLAVLFAHELHHFRRHHLGFHPKQGEHKANQWALEQASNLGFRTRGKRIPIRRRTRMVRRAWTRLFFPDPYPLFRVLKAGTPILVAHDPRGRYTGQPATALRPLRSNARRLTIRTEDGKTWRWPVGWLSLKDVPPPSASVSGTTSPEDP